MLDIPLYLKENSVGFGLILICNRQQVWQWWNLQKVSIGEYIRVVLHFEPPDVQNHFATEKFTIRVKVCEVVWAALLGCEAGFSFIPAQPSIPCCVAHWSCGQQRMHIYIERETQCWYEKKTTLQPIWHTLSSPIVFDGRCDCLMIRWKHSYWAVVIWFRVDWGSPWFTCSW